MDLWNVQRRLHYLSHECTIIFILDPRDYQVDVVQNCYSRLLSWLPFNVCTVIHYHYHRLPFYINFLFCFYEVRHSVSDLPSRCVKCFLFLILLDVLLARMWAIIYELLALLRTWTNPFPPFHCLSFLSVVPSCLLSLLNWSKLPGSGHSVENSFWLSLIWSCMATSFLLHLLTRSYSFLVLCLQWVPSFSVTRLKPFLTHTHFWTNVYLQVVQIFFSTFHYWLVWAHLVGGPTVC